MELALSSGSGTQPPSTPTLRIKAIQQLLLEKGILPPGAVDRIVDVFEHKLGPKIGAKVVARAWIGPEYKRRHLNNGPDAIRGAWPLRSPEQTTGRGCRHADHRARKHADCSQ